MKKKEEGYIVEGYLFATQKEADEAEKELQGIRYLQKNNNMKDIKVLEQVYCKVLEQGLFHTPVGLNYLKYLQNTMKSRGIEEIIPIPVKQSGMDKGTTMSLKRRMLQLDDVGGVYRRKYRICIIVIAVMAVCMAGMLCIAATTNQPNILNYEQKIVDKYEQWEQELQNREQKLQKQNQDQ